MNDEQLALAIEALYQEAEKLKPGLLESERKRIRSRVKTLMAALPGFCQLPSGQPLAISGPGHLIVSRRETDDETRMRLRREKACGRILKLLAQDESRTLGALESKAAEMEDQLRRDSEIMAKHERRG